MGLSEEPPVHDGPEEIPSMPPDDWLPDERSPSFEECAKDAAGAVKCWKVETGL